MERFCYIQEKYYKDHPNFIKILDGGDKSKQGVRTHVCISVKINDYYALIPLRKNLGPDVRTFGRIGYSVPSESKPKAGLDYRYIMIIKDEEYIRFEKPRISLSQIRRINTQIDTIERQAIEYINGFIKTAKKGRIDRTAKYRESSLINYLDILIK